MARGQLPAAGLVPVEHELGGPLLRAVLDAPDDDAPRLVYADWLIERGEAARGEAIIEAIHADARSKDRLRLLHGAGLAALGSPIRDGRSYHNGWWHRGFLEMASISVHTFESAAAALLSRTPLRAVRLLRFGEELTETRLRAVAASPLLDRLAGADLDLFKGFDTEGPVRWLFAEDTRLASLRSLTFGHHRLSDEALAVLARVPFRQLESLTIRSPYAATGRMTPLLASASMGRLLLLDLVKANGGDGNEVALAVGRASHVRGLERLFLGDGIRDDGVEALASAAHLSKLTELRVSVSMTAEGVARISDAVFLDTLEELVVTGYAGDGAPEAWVPLLSSPRLAKLRRLDLSGCRVGDEGARALAASPHVSRLASVNLARGGVTDAGATALAEAPGLPSLRAVNLKENAVGKAARARLRERYTCTFSR